jgi:phosphate transport system permease protein
VSRARASGLDTTRTGAGAAASRRCYCVGGIVLVGLDQLVVRERPIPRLLGWLLRLIEQLQGPFTALPIIIYNWAGEAKAEFKTALAPATIIVLMAIMFFCNGVAVFLRNRYDKRW